MGDLSVVKRDLKLKSNEIQFLRSGIHCDKKLVPQYGKKSELEERTCRAPVGAGVLSTTVADG